MFKSETSAEYFEFNRLCGAVIIVNFVGYEYIVLGLCNKKCQHLRISIKQWTIFLYCIKNTQHFL
jgi:hypothetical protein